MNVISYLLSLEMGKYGCQGEAWIYASLLLKHNSRFSVQVSIKCTHIQFLINTHDSYDIAGNRQALVQVYSNTREMNYVLTLMPQVSESSKPVHCLCLSQTLTVLPMGSEQILVSL